MRQTVKKKKFCTVHEYASSHWQFYIEEESKNKHAKTEELKKRLTPSVSRSSP